MVPAKKQVKWLAKYSGTAGFLGASDNPVKTVVGQVRQNLQFEVILQSKWHFCSLIYLIKSPKNTSPDPLSPSYGLLSEIGPQEYRPIVLDTQHKDRKILIFFPDRSQ